MKYIIGNFYEKSGNISDANGTESAGPKPHGILNNLIKNHLLKAG